MRRSACAQNILLKQIDRRSEQHEILHQKEIGQGRGRKPSGRGGPRIGKERYDGYRRHVGRARAQRAQNTYLLVPKSYEEEQAEQPLGAAEKESGATYAKQGIKPKDQRSVLDERDDRMGLVVEPLLATENQKKRDHRCAHQVIIEVTSNDLEF